MKETSTCIDKKNVLGLRSQRKRQQGSNCRMNDEGLQSRREGRCRYSKGFTKRKEEKEKNIFVCFLSSRRRKDINHLDRESIN